MKVGAEAIQDKGWLNAHKWLLLRRLSQLGILALFLLGPVAGIWLVKGNLAYSLTLNTVPLADPYVLLQSLLAGHIPEKLALIGVAIVVVFYAIAGGRAYCAWVCPLNMVTDFSAWLRHHFDIKGGARFSRTTRYWILGMTLALAFATGTLAWEMLNPVSMLHRGLIFGMGTGWAIIIGIFLFDLFVSPEGWCGHLCPVGAFYSLIGKASLVRVKATRRAACNDCMDCFVVCPEPQVIKPALKGASKGFGPTITAANCTNCGRCIDVCSKDVFGFGLRFNNKADSNTPKGDMTALGNRP